MDQKASKYQSLIKLLLVITAFFISLLILEMVTRITIGAKNKKVVLGFYKNDELIAQSLKPNINTKLESRVKGEFLVDIHTTSQGFRDVKEYIIPKPESTFRILMLGDSFTLGHGVEIEQTFSKILENHLNNEFQQTNVEVINAGYASGFTWDEAYLFTKEKGLDYQPDLVIENVWVGNDLKEIGEHEYPKLDTNNLPEKIVSTRTMITEEGYLRAKNIASIRRVQGIPGIANEIICDNLEFCKVIFRPFIDRSIKNIKNKIRDEKSSSPYIDFLAKDINTETQKNWETGQRMLLALKNVLKDSNVNFMIVNIPVKEQIYDENNLLQGMETNTTRIGDFSKSSDIDYCDIGQKLKLKPEKVYYKFDAHLSAEGHKLTAEAVRDCFTNAGFLPLEPQSMAPSSPK